MTILEVCLDDLAGALTAERSGAHRIELCAALDDGGITPSVGTVTTVLASLTSMTVMVLIRQRGGDFVYSPAEVDAMVADITAIRSLPRADGVIVGFVIGALTADGTIDEAATTALLAACEEHPVTFHKAFDLTVDQPKALETLIELGVARVLTSGVTELHFRAPATVPSHGFQGGASALYDSGTRTVTSAALVREMRAVVDAS